MTRHARKAANHASVDQLSFLFADAPAVESAEPKVIALPVAAMVVVEIASAPAARLRRPKREVRRTMPITPPEDRRLTVKETAEILSVSVKTLEAWRRLGKGPEFVKVGRAVRYTMHALDQFTRERTVRNSAEGRMLDVQR